MEYLGDETFAGQSASASASGAGAAAGALAASPSLAAVQNDGAGAPSNRAGMPQTLANQFAASVSSPSQLPHTPQQAQQSPDGMGSSMVDTPDSPEDMPYDPADPYSGMPPPPPLTYPSLEALMAGCQEHGRAHGYACVTSSNNYRRGIAYVRCDRGGEYVNHWNVTPETRVRKNRTRRLVGCKWKARAKRNPNTGEWSLTMMEDKHNGHGPSRDLSRHPSLRQLPTDAVNEAKSMFEQGRTPKEVLEQLKRWNGVVTAQDVYNLKAKIQRGSKDRPTPGERSSEQKAYTKKLGGGAASGLNGSASRKQQTQPQQRADPGPSRVDDDLPMVDPALRNADANPGLGGSGLGHLTQAAAHMQDSPLNAQHLEAGRTGKKCTCNCCEH